MFYVHNYIDESLCIEFINDVLGNWYHANVCIFCKSKLCHTEILYLKSIYD